MLTTDLASPLLQVLDFLLLHHFCQNDFLCLLISIELYAYHSEERDPV